MNSLRSRPSKLKDSELDFLRNASQENLYFFAKFVLGFDWFQPHIHKPIADLLQDLSNTRLKIVLPRGWLKSTLCSISYPVWRAINNPQVRILLTQNTSTNAEAKLRAIGSVFKQNELFKALFPELLPDRDCIWRNDSMCIKRSGSLVESTFEAAGTKTQLTGRHYDDVIEDDTVAPDKDDLSTGAVLPAKEDIEQAIGYHQLMTPILSDIMSGRILVVGTRWFERDLMSWIDANEPYYKRYERASRETNGLADVNGTVAYPERFNEEVLAQLAASLGPYIYSCLYMNQPVNPNTMVFQKEWIQYYSELPLNCVSYTSCDPAGDPSTSKGSDTDYSVVVTCAKDLITGRVYVVEYTRKRMNPGEMIQEIFRHVRFYHPVTVGIESVAYQNTIQYWVKERMKAENLWFLVEPITHGKTSKQERIRALQPIVQAGMLAFRKQHTDLLAELESFPNGAHDDVVDCVSMQLRFWAMTQDLRKRSLAKEEANPHSVAGAIRSIQERQKPTHRLFSFLKAPLIKTYS